MALAVLCGLSLVVLMILGAVWHPLWGKLAVLVAILFGWVTGRMYESKSGTVGQGVRGEP